MNSSTTRPSARIQWIALGAIVIAAVVLLTVIVVQRGDDGQTAAEKQTELCALRDSSNEPLVDPNTSTSRDDLAATVRQRAEALRSAAEGVDGSTAKALTASADAMTKVADAIAADTSGANLADAIAELADDAEFQASTEILRTVLAEQCP